MTLIRVDPASVAQYARQAQATFDGMHGAMAALVEHTGGVRYFGPNAVAFKAECGRMAADFARTLHADLAGIAEAIRSSTSNIAVALGGAPIMIQVDTRAIVAPVPTATDYVDVDTSALEALVPAVAQRFEALREGLATHLSALQSADWQGNAKLAAVDAVGVFTASARRSCDSAEASICQYVRHQLSTVLAADR